jgi:hypothetical protein
VAWNGQEKTGSVMLTVMRLQRTLAKRERIKAAVENNAGPQHRFPDFKLGGMVKGYDGNKEFVNN